MGRSSSVVNSVSNTTYSNTPQTVQDNGVALNNASLITGQNNNSINGSTFNNLDGGAIASAFNFGTTVIKNTFRQQQENNALISRNNAASLNFADRTQNLVQETNNAALNFASRSQDLVDKKINAVAEKDASITRNLMIAAAVAIAFFYFKRG